MTEKTLYAHWHKFELKPPRDFKPDYLEPLVYYCFNLALTEFEPKASTTTATQDSEPKKKQYHETLTYRKLIDLEFINSPKWGKTLNRIVIQGRGLDTLPLDVGCALTYFEKNHFICTEAHSKILLPESLVKFLTIEKHFLTNSYTSDVKRVGKETDPSNGHATTWSVGRRPQNRSANTTHGKRVIFYEADKVHPEVEPGTTEMELQLFGDAAQKFVFGPGTRDADLTAKTIGVIRPFLTIKTLTGDSNVSRRSTAKWWQTLTGKFDAVHLPRLDRAAPKLDNQIKHFMSTLYSRKVILGKDLFLDTLVTWFTEAGLMPELLQLAAF